MPKQVSCDKGDEVKTYYKLIKQIAIIGGMSECGNCVEQVIVSHINPSSNVYPIHCANM